MSYIDETNIINYVKPKTSLTNQVI